MNKNENQPQQDRKGKGWSFTYFGQTPEPDSEVNQPASSSTFPLTKATSRTQVWVVGFRGKGGISRLLGMGLTPGTALQILSVQQTGSVVVAIADNRLGLGAGMAAQIMVTDQPITTQEERQMENQSQNQTVTFLRDLLPGTGGRVKGYEKAYRAYKSKLLSMGLTPGTEFTVIRVAPLGDPIEINVRGFNLSLRKQEAEALIVEALN